MKKMLLFGFEDPALILAAAAAVKPFGAEVVPVPRTSYGQTIGALAEKGLVPGEPGSPLGQRMMVFCGLEKELDGLLDGLLDALASSGAGAGSLKAVLTPNNRHWNARQLCQELQREHRALRQGGKK